MDYLHKIVEERIQNAQREGLFDNLPGKGKPLRLDDDSGVPEDLRLTFKILKNSNCLPIEMELRKEIFSLRQLLNAAIDPEFSFLTWKRPGCATAIASISRSGILPMLP